MKVLKGINRLFMPFYLLGTIKGTRSFWYYRYLQKTQWLTQSQLKEIQENKLRSLLLHVYNNVPYYNRIFKERDLKPYDIKRNEDLAKLPITTKDDMRSNFSDFIARNYREYKPSINFTSGSTGEPFQYYLDEESLGMARATQWRGYGYAGYRLGDRMAILAGPSIIPQILSGDPIPSPSKINRFLISHPDENTLYLPALSLDEKIMKKYAEMLVRFKPRFIRGNPSALHLFAYFLREKGIVNIRPVAILTTSEKLFHFQRELLEEVFQCEVFDGYGAFDSAVTAYECEEHNGYHMVVERAVMEFIDDEGEPVSPGDTGRIISTNLYNYVMPFIRFDTKDLGIPLDSHCACGRGLSLMKEIVGRVVDVLKFEDGTILSGWPLTLLFARFDIKRFQIVQTSGKSIVVKIVKGRKYSNEDTQRLLSILRNYLSKNIDIQFQFVEEIPPTRGGKWKYIVSEMT